MGWQYDAFEIGFITTDDFTNADILEATYPAVAKRLHDDWFSDPAIPVVTGFLGKVFLMPCFCSASFRFFSFCPTFPRLSRYQNENSQIRKTL